MSQFAKETEGKLKIVGLGATDSLGEAKDFYNRYGVREATMLWDRSGNSWRRLGVFGQPAWLLLDENGEVLIRARGGGINESAVKEQIS